jgi:hypothetical protein
MLYNFPGVTGGIDMTSDLVEDIAKSAPNTCGIKLTWVLYNGVLGRDCRGQDEIL